MPCARGNAPVPATFVRIPAEPHRADGSSLVSPRFVFALRSCQGWDVTLAYQCRCSSGEEAPLPTADLLARFQDRLSLPLIAAPMFLISGVELVVAACRNGVIGSFPT